MLLLRTLRMGYYLLAIAVMLILSIGFILGKRSIVRQIRLHNAFQAFGTYYECVYISKDNPSNGTPSVIAEYDDHQGDLNTASDAFAVGTLDKIKTLKNKTFTEKFDCVQCRLDAGAIADKEIKCSICGNARCPKALNHKLSCLSENTLC